MNDYFFIKRIYFPIKLLFFILLVVFSFCANLYSLDFHESKVAIQLPIVLNGKWKLFIGDHDKIKDLSYDISSLKSVTIPGRYYKQGYKNIKGYSWLIKEFTLTEIPSINLGIYLGEIKSIDETYLNGELIGKTGAVHPKLIQAFDRLRIYSLPGKYLKVGKNILSIRIYSPQKRGGIKSNRVVIDSYSKLVKNENKRLLFIGIVSVISIFVGFMFIFIYRYFSTFRESLFFGYMSIFLGLYIIFSDQLKYLISDSFFLMKKIEYLLMFPIPMFYLHFIFNLTNSKKNIMRPILFILGLFFVLLAFASHDEVWLMKLLRFWQVYFVFAISFGIFLHLQKWKKLKSESKFFLMAYFATAFTAFFDLMRSLGWHTYPKLLSLGVFISLLGISIVLSIRYKKIFISIREQYANLKDIVENSSSILNINDLSIRLYELFLVRFKTNHFVFYIINSDKTYKFFGNKYWKNIGEKLNHIQSEEEILDKFYVMAKQWEFENVKEDDNNLFYYFPILLNNTYKGFIAGSYISILGNDTFFSILKILHFDIVNMLLSFEYKNDLEKLNQNLEKIIKTRTSQIQLKNRELKKLNQIRREFFANITHDIKTPLSLMSVSIESLLNHSKNKKDIKVNYYEKLKHNTYRIILMINSLLDVSKVESGKLELNLVYADFTAFVKSITDLYVEVIEQLDMKLIVNLPEEAIYTSFDYEKFEKIINNLLSNAIKFNQKNKPIIIRVFLKDKKYFIFSILDHGKGIPKNEMKDVFERYQQKHDETGISKMGIGLGLSIVKDLVELHKGKIIVKSELNKQTEFIMTIPLRTREQQTINDMQHHINSLYVTHQHNQKLQSRINKNSFIFNSKKSFTNLYFVSKVLQEVIYNFKELFEDYNLKEMSSLQEMMRTIRSIQRNEINNISEEFNIFVIENSSKKLSQKIIGIIRELNHLFIPVVIIDKTAQVKKSLPKNILIDEIIHPPYYPSELRFKLYLLETQKKLRNHLHGSDR